MREPPARQRLLHRQQADWAALVVIGVQQRWPSLPLDDSGQLPGQVVSILDAGIAPSPPVGGTM